MMELTTEQLNTSQLMEGTKQVINILLNTKVELVDIEYGYLSREDHEYTTKQNIATDDLLGILDDGISNDIIRLGLSDFLIKTSEFEYHICNDSDLHFRSDNANLLNLVKAKWEECGFKIYIVS